MNFNFKTATLSEKLILGSACLAIISLFLPWVSAFGLSLNGFQQEGYLLLILFLYPVIIILTGKLMKKAVGIVSGALGTIFMIYFISTKSTDLLGASINAAGVGTYVCIASLVALAVGSLMYEK